LEVKTEMHIIWW